MLVDTNKNGYTDTNSDTEANGWLTAEYDYLPPRRGQIREGVVLDCNDDWITVDVGLKREGIVPRWDIDRLSDDFSTEIKPGKAVKAKIVKSEDQNGNLILSLSQIEEKRHWEEAQELFEANQILHCKVIGYNQGGLLIRFKQLQGFIPASHISTSSKRDLNVTAKYGKGMLKPYLGEELPLKIIEVDQSKRRLIVSERLARKKLNEEKINQLLDTLSVGQTCRGTVAGLSDFGAFIDIGGIEALAHISELAWHRVEHPSEVLEIGQEVETYILDLDYDRRRINLSIKRLQQNPWETIQERYYVGQLVVATVTNVVDFGVFAAVEDGVEGLIHFNEFGESFSQDLIQSGDKVFVRILFIDLDSQRISLSLKDVTPEECRNWLTQQADSNEIDLTNFVLPPGTLVESDEDEIAPDDNLTEVSDVVEPSQILQDEVHEDEVHENEVHEDEAPKDEVHEYESV